MQEPVGKVRDDQLREAQGTPGLTRRVAFEADRHWFGHVEASPETMSGWHHHGDNVTLGYFLKGKVTLEFGAGGREHVEVNEGEYFEVPKHLVHGEGNMSTETGEIILGRAPDARTHAIRKPAAYLTPLASPAARPGIIRSGS